MYDFDFTHGNANNPDSNSQWLGFWSLKDKDISKTPLPNYNAIDNESYRSYRKDAKKGGDFYRYSNMYITHPNFTFKL